MPAIIQFVDSIAASPTVRLDLNSRASRLMIAKAGLSLTPPPMRRVASSTTLADGEHISAESFGNRVVGVPIQLIDAASADEAATVLQQLARELNRPFNFLKVQLDGMTSPVFFRTFRAPDYSFEMLRLLLAEKTSVGLELMAEPFAFGLPETLPTVTVRADPANASNGNWLDVSGVKGDVEAVTKITNSGADFTNDKILLATRRRGTPANVPYLVQAESMTQGTDTTVQANDAVMSGAGSNYSRCTFATASMQTRLTIATWPSSPSVDARGTYRVLLRCRHSVSGDVISVNLQVKPPGTSTAVTLSTTTLPNVTAVTHVDLGLISLPFGADPVFDGPSGVELSVASVSVLIQAQRVSGSGNLDVDCLLFVPADDQLAFVDVGDDASPTAYVFDSYNDVVYASATGKVDASADIVPLGGLPTVQPGVTNRIYLVSGLNGDPAGVTDTADMIVTYWPQYLTVRPATT